jgi:sugar lactone lactonase YvrE
MKSRLVWLFLAFAAGCGTRTELYLQSGARSGAGGSGSTGASSGSGSGGGGGVACTPDGLACDAAIPCCTACVDGTCGSPACTKGEGPVTLASGLIWPFGLVVDEASVYFTLYDGDGAVMKVPKAGGEAATLLAGLDYPDQMVMDDTHLYFTVSGAGQVLKMSKDGGDVTTLASRQGGPSGIAADATNLYWANNFSGSLVSVSKSGGSTITLVIGEQIPYRVAAGTTDLFWSGFPPGLRAVPKTGGSAVQIVNGNPRTMATDGDGVYWTDTGDATVKRADQDGSDLQIIAVLEGGAFPDGIAVDETHVYFTVGMAVMKVDKLGGTAEVIAEGQDLPAIVALDRSCVYWTNTSVFGGNGSVMRAPK